MQDPQIGLTDAEQNDYDDQSIAAAARAEYDAFSEALAAVYEAHGLPVQAPSFRDVTALALAQCGDRFTLTGVRTLHEAMTGNVYCPANFRRSVIASGLIVPTGVTDPPGPEGGRPAELFRRAS